MSLTEICRRQSIPKAAAYRALSALVRNGFVEQDATSEWYRLTLKTTTIGLRYLAEIGITEVCQPVLDRLAARTEELVRLVVANGDTLIWVAKTQGAMWGLRYDPDMGQTVVLHATAAGRAWLSTLDEDEAVTVVLERGFSVPAQFHRRSSQARPPCASSCGPRESAATASRSRKARRAPPPSLFPFSTRWTSEIGRWGRSVSPGPVVPISPVHASPKSSPTFVPQRSSYHRFGRSAAS